MTPTEFRTIRARLGLSQAQLSPRIHRSVRQISAIECGGRVDFLLASFMRLLEDDAALAARYLELEE